MAKNFATIHASGNDAIALEQKVFLKQETARGVLELPGDTDLMLINTGASVNFTQPIDSSPVRSDRHHTSIIRQKTNTEWTLPSFFHVDTTLGAASDAEIDVPYRLLWKSMLGREQVTPLIYDAATPPDVTFSLFSNGDQWALQAPGSFVQSANAQLPGDGDATVEFAGMSKTALLVGVGKSIVDNNAANTVTLGTGEGERFPVGAQVMLIAADGQTKSADTAVGTARSVTLVAGDVITLDGAVLADADGAAADVFVVYYEPDAPVAINDPLTGLTGTVTIVGLAVDCVRSISLNMQNNHEPTDFCFGEEGLAGPLFTPGDRLTVELSMELNLNHQLVEFLNRQRDFPGENIEVILGDSAGRHVKFEVPKAIFPVPEISVPDTGTIPITFTGNAYQSALDAADEITLSFL